MLVSCDVKVRNWRLGHWLRTESVTPRVAERHGGAADDGAAIGSVDDHSAKLEIVELALGNVDDMVPELRIDVPVGLNVEHAGMRLSLRSLGPRASPLRMSSEPTRRCQGKSFGQALMKAWWLWGSSATTEE